MKDNAVKKYEDVILVFHDEFEVMPSSDSLSLCTFNEICEYSDYSSNSFRIKVLNLKLSCINLKQSNIWLHIKSFKPTTVCANTFFSVIVIKIFFLQSQRHEHSSWQEGYLKPLRTQRHIQIPLQKHLSHIIYYINTSVKPFSSFLRGGRV